MNDWHKKELWWGNDRMLASEMRRIVEPLAERASDRKVRLFGVACCRLIWDQLCDERQRVAVEVAEQFADGKVDDAARIEARQAADGILQRNSLLQRNSPDHTAATSRKVFGPSYAIDGLLADPAKEGIEDVVVYTAEWNGGYDWVPHVPLLRDIFGNPFRPVPFAPEWRTTTAVWIARGMYDSCDFSAMPILADALQDAGCEQQEALNHCRGGGAHVRGCWVVDQVLAKE